MEKRLLFLPKGWIPIGVATCETWKAGENGARVICFGSGLHDCYMHQVSQRYLACLVNVLVVSDELLRCQFAHLEEHWLRRLT